MSDEQQPASKGVKAGAKKGGAGKCDRCGYCKTWQYTVLNPTSGKFMPAHINSKDPNVQAEVLGDGYCPKLDDPPVPKPGAAAPAEIETPVKVPKNTETKITLKPQAVVEKVFGVDDDSKRLIAIVKTAIHQALSDEFREIAAILREIRDGKNRTAINADGGEKATADLPGRSRP